MEIREATDADFESIRAIADSSLHTSYEDFLDAEIIDTAASEWYDDEALEEQLADDGAVLLVGVDDGDDSGNVIAFSQAQVQGETPVEGRITWLHVDPDARGRGIGARLLVRTQEELLDRGAEQLAGVVLEGNELGNEFYEAHGYEHASERTVEIGGTEMRENVFIRAGEADETNWETLDEFDTEDGAVYVSYSESNRGSNGPFYQAYVDEARDRKYGWFCGACQSFETAMSSMGEVICNECENRRKPTRWDASYL
ncbi:GNAT family N-acetyltransferase [Haloarchaeobius sp. DFWS5]|uniref:GNAT family N-acetyltransferase n=1 Tax=Haloarchaeobius sp. DFWS5 TaxID=3446114 RepID=UPI003EB9ACC5